MQLRSGRMGTHCGRVGIRAAMCRDPCARPPHQLTVGNTARVTQRNTESHTDNNDSSTRRGSCLACATPQGLPGSGILPGAVAPCDDCGLRINSVTPTNTVTPKPCKPHPSARSSHRHLDLGVFAHLFLGREAVVSAAAAGGVTPAPPLPQPGATNLRKDPTQPYQW